MAESLRAQGLSDEPQAVGPPVVEEDYYVAQARLNPVDNRTGRRTYRRASPGPPVRSSGGADLARLAALTPDDLPATEGIPMYRMTAIALPRPVPVDAVTQALSQPVQLGAIVGNETNNGSRVPQLTGRVRTRRVVSPVRGPSICYGPAGPYHDVYSHFTLGRFMANLERSKPGWTMAKPVKFMPDGALRPADDHFNKILDKLRCQKCNVLSLTNCVVCLEKGHMMCWECVLRSSPSVDGRKVIYICSLCPSTNAGSEGRKIPDWCTFLTAPELQFKCDYEKDGCTEVGHLQKHLDHIKICPKAWRCLYCTETIPLAGMVRHLWNHYIGHGRRKISYNFTRKIDSYKLEMSVPIHGRGILMESPPERSPFKGCFGDFQVGVKEVRIRGIGRFVLYQIKTGRRKYIWFLVMAGNEAEASAYEAKFVVTTRYPGPRDANTEVMFKRVCVSKVYPWNLDIKKVLREVSDDHDGMVARFNYDWTDEARKWIADRKELKSLWEHDRRITSRFQSKLEITVQSRTELLKPKYKRLFYSCARILHKPTRV